MKPIRRTKQHVPVAGDLGGLASVGLMIGTILAAAGIAQHHPVLISIAAAYGVRPVLTPAQTLFLGLFLILAGGALFARTLRSKTRRR